MKTYHMELLVRPDDEEGPETPLTAQGDAENEEEMRRDVLNSVYRRGWLVSHFIKVIELGAKS